MFRDTQATAVLYYNECDSSMVFIGNLNIILKNKKQVGEMTIYTTGMTSSMLLRGHRIVVNSKHHNRQYCLDNIEITERIESDADDYQWGLRTYGNKISMKFESDILKECGSAGTELKIDPRYPCILKMEEEEEEVPLTNYFEKTND